MTRGRKILAALVGLGVTAYLLRPKTASAAPAPLPPSGGSRTTVYPTPPDGMPWNRYSVRTLTRQREFNGFARADQFFGFPLLAEDGILGPLTCEALTDSIYRIQPFYPGSAPVACVDASWRVPVLQ